MGFNLNLQRLHQGRFHTEPVEKKSKPQLKLYPNHTKNPRLSKSGLKVLRWYTRNQIITLNAFHANSIHQNKITRAKYEASQRVGISA